MLRSSRKITSVSPEKAVNRTNVDGYTHRVSPLKTPANPNSSRYFDFTIQEASQETRVICFSPNKREEFKEKEQSKLPVQLTNMSPQKRRNAEEIEYKMNKFSRLSPAKNLPLPWKESADLSQTYTIKQIQGTKVSGDLVSIKVKVCSKSEKEIVYSNHLKKHLTKCDVTVADAAGAITLILWENHIDEVNTGSFYCFQELKVNYFNKKYLNSNPSCLKNPLVQLMLCNQRRKQQQLHVYLDPSSQLM